MAYPFFLQLATVLLMVSLIMAAVFRMHHLAKRLDNVPVNQTYMGEDVTSVKPGHWGFTIRPLGECQG